jgi:hypothetical protein
MWLPDLGVDVDALDLDEARLAVRKHRARDRPLARLADHGQLDIAVEDPGLFLRRGRHVDAALRAITGPETMLISGFVALHHARNGRAVQRREVHPPRRR